MLFRAHLRDAWCIAFVSVLGFGGARLGSSLLGPEQGVLLGALLVGVASNAIARWMGRPASVTLVPGIMLLVPGSIGFGSMSSLLARDVDAGLALAFTTVLVAVALAIGLLLANVIVPPRRSL